MNAFRDSLQNEVDREIAKLLQQGMVEESDIQYASDPDKVKAIENFQVCIFGGHELLL